MRRLLPAVLVALAVAAPAYAGERPHLVAGGMTAPRVDAGPAMADLFAIGGLRVGALVDAAPISDAEPGNLALGGYAGYGLDGFGLTSALRGDALSSEASLAASYAHSAGQTSLTLGYAWDSGLGAFSLNPLQPGGLDALRPLNDLSLSLSYFHDMTSTASLGGFAAASRSEYEDRTTQHGFRVGAVFGLKF